MLGLLVIALGLLLGTDIAALIGLGADETLGAVLGLGLGVAVAALFFGVPILVITMHQNLAHSTKLLESIDKRLKISSPATKADEPA